MINLINLNKDQGYIRLSNSLKRNNIDMEYFSITGISCDNEYIPLYAPLINRGIYNKQIVHYSLPHTRQYRQRRTMSTYMNLYAHLLNGTATKIFKTKSMEFKLLVIKGAIFEQLSDTQVELLFTIAVKEDYMIQMFKDKPNFDLSKFAMIVSNRLISDPRYKIVYRKLQSEIINPHLLKGVDMITTNNIVGKCFTSNVKVPKFRDISEMKEYLHAFNLEI